jgi:hypothetical protein
MWDGVEMDSNGKISKRSVIRNGPFDFYDNDPDGKKKGEGEGSETNKIWPTKH